MVEARLQGWEVSVQAYDPYVPGTIPLDQLLATSDVVSLHVVLTAETRNIIGGVDVAAAVAFCAEPSRSASMNGRTFDICDHLSDITCCLLHPQECER